jgi:AraC family transcriptional regulator of arabinose operon
MAAYTDLDKLRAAAEGVRHACPHEPTEPRVVQAVEVIEGLLGQRAQVEAIAREIGVSSSRLRHVFKEHTGWTLTQYARAVRMAVVRELLNATDLSIQEVAWEVRTNPSHLIRQFAARFGVPPQKYRAVARAQHAPGKALAARET